MDYQFRSALNGFNRSDVVVYLQNLTEAHKSALLAAQTEASRAAEERDRLRTENRSLLAKLDARPADAAPEKPEEPPLPQKELEAYRRAEAAERSAAAKAADIEAGARARAEAIVAEAKAHAAALEAEATEKLETARRTMQDLLHSASARLGGDQEGLGAMTASVSAQLAALQEQLGGMTDFLRETAETLSNVPLK